MGQKGEVLTHVVAAVILLDQRIASVTPLPTMLRSHLRQLLVFWVFGTVRPGMKLALAQGTGGRLTAAGGSLVLDARRRDPQATRRRMTVCPLCGRGR